MSRQAYLAPLVGELRVDVLAAQQLGICRCKFAVASRLEAVDGRRVVRVGHARLPLEAEELFTAAAQLNFGGPHEVLIPALQS
eukprot:6944609-Prymnesium_polylepis.1